MALEKRSVQIPLGEGVQEGIAAKLVDPPSLASLIDARWDKRGEYAKRFGALRTASAGLPSGMKAHSVLDHEDSLLEQTSDGMHIYDAVDDAWRRPNAAGPRPSRVTGDPVARGNGTFEYADVAFDDVSGVLCVCYRDDENDVVRTAFYNMNNDGTALAVDVSVPTEIKERPHVIACDGKLHLIGWNNDTARDIYVSTYNPLSGGYVWGAAALVHAAGSLGGFDAHCAEGENLWHLATIDGAGGWKCYQMQGGTSIANKVETSASTPTAIAVYHNPAIAAARVYILIYDTGTAPDQLTIDYFADDYLSAAAASQKVLDPKIVTDTSRRVTLALDGYSSTDLVCFVSHTESDGLTIGGVDWKKVTKDGVATGSQGFVPGVILATQAETVNERCYVGVSREIAFELNSEGPADEPIPCGFLVTPVTTITNALDLAVVGRFGHDFIYSRWTAAGFQYIGSLVYCGVDGTKSGAPISPALTAAFRVLIASNPGATSAVYDQGWRWGIDRFTADIEDVPIEVSSAERLALHGGGTLACFDGARSAECLIPFVPHQLRRTGEGTVGGLIGDAIYGAGLSPKYTGVGASLLTYASTGTANEYVIGRWKVKYLLRWVDAKGNTHRSSLSAPREYTAHGVGGGVGDLTFTGTGNNGEHYLTAYDDRVYLLPLPAMTALNGEGGPKLQVEFYRTGILIEHYGEVAGASDTLLGSNPASSQSTTTYYLVGILNISNAAAFGYPNLGYFVDPYASPHVNPGTSSPPPYDASGELGSEPIPPVLDVCSTQQRLFAVSGEDRLSVWHSKPFVRGYAPEFNAALQIRCAADGGDLVACEVLDDKLILFKRHRIYVTPVLSGPDALGNGSAFDPPREFVSDTGCVSAVSVVKGPFGVLFRSVRGIQLLDRSLSTHYIGEAVESTLAGRVIRAATLVPEYSEVRFLIENLTGEGVPQDHLTIVWNYRVSSWAVWEDIEGRHACLTGPTPVRLLSDGSAHFELADAYYGASGLGAENVPQLRITTAWIKLAGLQGFARVWRATLLGAYSTNGITVSVGYNYVDTWVDTYAWTADELAALTDPSRLQLQLTPGRQKCEAIRFKISETFGSYGAGADRGAGFVLTGLQLDCGVKRGSFKHTQKDAKG